MKKRHVLLAFAASFGLAAEGGARADTVTDWNVIAVNAIPAPEQLGPPAPRILGQVHAAMFDAVNAVERRYTPFRVDLNVPGASADAAAMTAAHGALVKLFPGQRVALDALLDKSLAKLADGKAKDDGVLLGRMVVEKSDISLDDINAPDQTYKLGTSPSSWQPYPTTAPLRGVAWSKIKPFTLKSAEQFTLPGPLAVDSPQYAKEIDEVRVLGGRSSTERTNPQTATAIFWTVGPGPLYNDIARKESQSRKLDLAANARLFALLNFAMADTSIATWDIKWKQGFLRPQTAIHNASKLGNPNIAEDKAWEPLIVVPGHPDYPSGHASLTGAATTIFRKIFESEEIASKPSYTYPAGAITQQWSTWAALIKDNANGRVWAGIHTRTACDHGTTLGQQVGEYVFANFLRPAKG